MSSVSQILLYIFSPGKSVLLNMKVVNEFVFDVALDPLRRLHTFRVIGVVFLFC